MRWRWYLIIKHWATKLTEGILANRLPGFQYLAKIYRLDPVGI